MDKRVVITGVGLVTPLGVGVEETWTSLCAGKSGISEITRFDTSEFKTKIAGEIKNFQPEDFLPRKEARRAQPYISYAVAASRMAIEDSGICIDESNADRVGVITGCGIGGIGLVEDTAIAMEKNGPKKVSPFYIPMLIGSMASGMISIKSGARGPNSTISSACAASAHAVGDSYKIIQRGSADVMITGGTESAITPTSVAGFNAMRALSTRNSQPEKASRPFDSGRDGFVIGEGSGILIIESLEHALERGAGIIAEICGYGMSSDGYHITAPSPEGEGAAKCMQAALDDAGINSKDVDYINAHGTSTPANDVYETMAIKTVFKDNLDNIAISSTKSMTGHLLGGSGGMEAVFTALTIYNSVIPPTINLDNPSEECDLDYVPHVSREKSVKYAMTNSFGFGGTNASLILKKYME